METQIARELTAQAPTAKGGRTREQILEAAARLFAERGYEGTSIRDLEAAAGVNRGVATYHFGNKAELWKAMFRFVFQPYVDDLNSKAELLRALDADARDRILVAGFVRTSAERPYMNRLMIQENFCESWRTDWIIEQFLRPMQALFRTLGDETPMLRLLGTDPHVRYALLGACNMVFSHPCEVKALFGADVADEDFINRHVATVLELYEAWVAAKSARN